MCAFIRLRQLPLSFPPRLIRSRQLPSSIRLSSLDRVPTNACQAARDADNGQPGKKSARGNQKSGSVWGLRFGVRGAGCGIHKTTRKARSELPRRLVG
eukprot:scaffold305_cov247-Pinguiococcus_pyrenoidosus.AAC.35